MNTNPATKPATNPESLRSVKLSKPVGSKNRSSTLSSILKALVVLSLLGIVGWLVVAGMDLLKHDDRKIDSELTAVASIADLSIEISGGGELQSAKSIDVFCDVEGQDIKIVEMLPEGTHVRVGQVVMRLDPSAVNTRLAEQQIVAAKAQAAAMAAVEELKIQKNLAASTSAQAKLKLTLANLDLKQYVQGDFSVQLNDLNGLIALANSDLQEAADVAEHFTRLVKKGFTTRQQLRAKQQAVKRAQYYLNRDEEKLRILKEFTRERQLAELSVTAEEAARELERANSSGQAAIVKAETDLKVANATTKMEDEQLAKLQKQIEACTVQATADGTLVYAHDKKNPLEVGADVYYKRKLFSVPDMTKMRVLAYVHESMVKRIKPGLQAEVYVEAFPNRILHGTVGDVATFYDSTRHWLSGGVKDYETSIVIDDLQDLPLRPGMTSNAKIMVQEIPGALVIPIQAVTEQDEQHFCYVVGPESWQRRPVSIGENNGSHVQIIGGLDDGERVALNAKQMATLEVAGQLSVATSKSATRKNQATMLTSHSP